MNYPAMTNREYRSHINGDGEAMRDRYDREVMRYDVLAAELAEQALGRWNDDLFEAVMAERSVRSDDLAAILAAQSLTPRVRGDRELACHIEQCLESLIDSSDIERVGVLLGVWPSFDTWCEQQAEADEARALDMRYGDRI